MSKSSNILSISFCKNNYRSQNSFLLIVFMLMIETSRFLMISYLPFINGSLSLVFILGILVLLNLSCEISIPRSIFVVLAIICFFIGVETLYFFYTSPNFNNLFNGIFVFPIFILVVYIFSFTLIKLNLEIIHVSFKAITYILLIFGWLSALFPSINNVLGYNYNNPVFPFTEPSHYALSLMPVLLGYGINESNKIRMFLLVNMALLALLFPNLTLLLSVLFTSFMFWGIKRPKLSLVIIFLLFLFFIFLLSKFPYFSNRLLNFGTKSDNLSVLVYIQGWQDMIKAFTETNGLGLGYRMMGTNTPSEIALRIKSLGFGELNRTDGSFLASKLITEFGLFGLCFILFSFAYLMKLFKWVFWRKNNSFDKKSALLLCLSSSIVMELLIRGGDYFSSQVLLSLSAFIALIMIYRKEIQLKKDE